MLVNENLDHAFAGCLAKCGITTFNVSKKGWYESIVDFRDMEETETFGKVVQEGRMLSPQAHHCAYVLVVVLELWKKFLVDVFSLEFR